jgi:poly [ADP-ribose] polymerase 10/14/15
MQVLRTLVSSTLKMASADMLMSLAFPSIGTGNLKIPHAVVAKAMFDEVISFSAANRHGCSLRDVFFVIFQTDQQTIAAFEGELQQLHSSKLMSSMPSTSRYQSLQANRPAPKQNVQKFACCIGDVNILVKCGDITKEQCDAIVNSTNDKLDLRHGALSKAIVSAGGDSIVAECRKLGGAPSGIAITGAGKLPCKNIIHLVAKNDIKEWKTIVNLCFAMAEKLKFTSLAMPPVGTGRTGAGGTREVAEMILEEVGLLANSKPQYLKKIIITVQQQKMVEEFVSAAERADKPDARNQPTGFWALVPGFIRDKYVTYFKSSTTDSKPAASPETDAGTPTKRDEKQRQNVKPNAHRPAAAAGKLVLSIYGMSQPAIDAATRDVDKLCQDSKMVKILNKDDVKKMLETLTPEEERRIMQLEKQYDATIKLFKPAGNPISARIEIEGERDAVSSVFQEIYEVLLEVKKRQSEEKEIELLADQAIWEYLDGTVYKLYSVLGRGTLEKALRDKKPTTEWIDTDGKHIVTLATPTNMEDTWGGKKMAVRRSLPGTVALPNDWANMTPGQTHLLVNLPATSPEYTTVKNSLYATANNMIQNVIKIERIQNPFLYRQYMAKKGEMDQTYPGTPYEMRLWHGTDGPTVPNINKNNFNRSYGGKHGLAYGNGVYFALNSAYSISGYSRADATGTKHIYQSRVLVGMSTTGQAGLIVPPAGFDSVTDPGKSMYIVFYDAQTYPEYLITFQ